MASNDGTPLERASTSNDTTDGWRCASCGTGDEALRYKSGKMKNCYTCQAFENARINSKQKAGKRAGIERKVDFTHDEFLAWAKENPRRCRYCRITDSEYFALGYMTSNGRQLEAIGLDRRDDTDYRLDNIDWCCYPCNRTKANSLTVSEMEIMGIAQELNWRRRLGKMEQAQDLMQRFCAIVTSSAEGDEHLPRMPLEWQDPLTRTPAVTVTTVRGMKGLRGRKHRKAAAAASRCC